MFKSGFGGGNRPIHILGVRIGNLRDHLFGGRIVNRKCLVRVAVNPLAIDIHLISANIRFNAAWHN